jgi:hypothetical protein
MNRNYITNHHQNCPHYNDSLIDVWKVSRLNSGFCYFDNEHDAIYAVDTEGGEDGDGEFTITKEKLHKEIYENIPEFEGF